MRGRLFYFRILTCALAALATLEICARVDDWLRFGAAFWTPYEMNDIFAADQFGRKGIPNARFENVQLNSLGYRGPEPRSGTIRIACIGASETFGIFEENGKQFPRQLEQRLNRTLGVSSIEVLNISHPGNNLAEGVRRLPEIIARLHPQFVVLYPSPVNFGTAEFFTQIYRPQATFSRPPARPNPWLHYPRAIVRRSEAILVRGYDSLTSLRLKRKIDQLQYSALPEWAMNLRLRFGLLWYRFRNRVYFERFPPEVDERYRRELLQAADLATRGGARLVLVLHANSIPPSFNSKDEAAMRWNSYYPYTSAEGLLDLENRLNRVMAQVAAERGLLLVDAARGIPKDPHYFGDFVHFTNDGSATMAALIAEKLQPPLREMLDPNRGDENR